MTEILTAQGVAAMLRISKRHVYGRRRNNYCDSGDCEARASRVKRGLASLF
jgi:hypothetical protein